MLLPDDTRVRAMEDCISFQESAPSCRPRWFPVLVEAASRQVQKRAESQPDRETEISDPDDSFAGPVSFLFDTHSSPRIRSCTPFTGLQWHAEAFFPHPPPPPPPSVWYNVFAPRPITTIFISFNFELLWGPRYFVRYFC